MLRLLVVLVAIAAAAAGGYAMGSSSGSDLPQANDHPQASKAENPYLPEEEQAFRAELHKAIGTLDGLSDIEKVKTILRHIADVAVIEGNWYGPTKERYRAYVVYRHMKRGIGHLCSGLADVFIGALEIYGLEARRIRAHNISPEHPDFDRFIENYVWDGHSTVEVKVDDRWILADPTFFMLPKLRGRYISLEEGIAAVVADRGAPFEYERVSDKYPVERYFKGKPANYWRGMFFGNVIAYEPFRKYPYNDIYRLRVDTDIRPVDAKFYAGDIILAEIPTPAITWEDLRPD